MKTEELKKNSQKRPSAGIALTSTAAKFAYIIVALLICANALTQAFPARTEIETETVIFYDVKNEKVLTGVFIRDETPLSSSVNDGTVAFHPLEDGARISNDSVITEYYMSAADAGSAYEKRLLEQHRDTLISAQSISSTSSVVESSLLKNQFQISRMNESESYTSASELKNELILLLAQKHILLNSSQNPEKSPEKSEDENLQQNNQDYFSEAINMLNRSIAQLNSSPVSTDTADTLGYFGTRSDGWENHLKTADIENLISGDSSEISPENSEILSNIRGALSEPYRTDSSSKGKVITTYKWYLAALAEKSDFTVDERDYFSANIGMEISAYSESDSKPLPLTVMKVIDNGDGTEFVIFKGENFYGEVAGSRTIDFRVKIQTNVNGLYTSVVSGLRIPKSAVHTVRILEMVLSEKKDEKGNIIKKEIKKLDTPLDQQGVYVLLGNKLYFRAVKVINSYEDFLIVENTADYQLFEYIDSSGTEYSSLKVILDDGIEMNLYYLSPYQSIAVKGKGLYDGKVIR